MKNRMSLQTKSRILKSFFNLLHTYSFDDITVLNIATEAEISRNTFYRYFNSKDQLFNEYLDQLMHEWINYISEKQPKSNPELIDLLFNFWKTYSYEFKVMINADLNARILERFNEIFPNYFIQFRKGEYISPKEAVDLKYISYLRLGGIWNVFSNWLIHPNEITFNSLLDIVKSEYQ